MSECLDKALEMASQGHPVFPCEWRGENAKKPLTDHGFQDASTDENTINMWWSENPEAAIGYPTGIKYDVLDIDLKETNGVAALNLLKGFGLLEGYEKSVKTPSKGIHLYYPVDTNSPIPNKQIPSAGVDVRGAGGYVIIPPSKINGEQYRYMYESDEPGFPLPWKQIEPLLTSKESIPKSYDSPPSAGEHSLEALQGWVSQLKPGERNAGLFWACCRAIEGGHDPRKLADAAFTAGLTGSEIKSTIRSAFRSGGKKGGSTS